MKYSSILPTEPFQPFINCFWMLESGPDEIGKKIRSTPDGMVELSFQLSVPWKWGYNQAKPEVISPTKLIGQFSQSLEMEMTGVSKNFYIKLFPWAFYALFGIPVNKFTDLHVSLEEILGQEITEVHELLMECENITAMRDAAQAWLSHKIRGLHEVNKDSLSIAKTIYLKNGVIKIKDLARGYSRSQRWLQQEIIKLTGVTPKQYAKFRRNFQAAKAMRNVKSLTELSYKLGYNDQSHFIHDFTEFAGCTPGAYLKKINPDGEFNNFFI